MPRVEEMVERVWPGRDARIETLGGGITNRNFKVSVDGGAYVLRIGGRDTELLGIDRRAEHEASLAAAAVGVGPEVIAFIEPEGYLVTRFIEGEVVVPEAIREPRAAAAGRAGAAGDPRRPADPGAVRLLPRRRGVRRDRGRARDRGPGRLRARARARSRGRARPRACPRAAVPQRPPDRELHRRRHPDPDRRLGVRRHGRRLLRPRELRRQQRPARGGDDGAAARLLRRRSPRSTSGR